MNTIRPMPAKDRLLILKTEIGNLMWDAKKIENEECRQALLSVLTVMRTFVDVMVEKK